MVWLLVVVGLGGATTGFGAELVVTGGGAEDVVTGSCVAVAVWVVVVVDLWTAAL